MSRKVLSFLNNLAVGETLLLRSREIDGLKFARFFRAGMWIPASYSINATLRECAQGSLLKP
jgi:hypothetical protein